MAGLHAQRLAALPDELHARLQSAVSFAVTRGPEYETYPAASDEPLAIIDDAQVTRRLVDALQADGLEHRVVVQAHGGLTLVFFDAAQDVVDSVTLLPGWMRYGGWPNDARLSTPADVFSILAEQGVGLAWSPVALRAVDDVEPHIPAARRRGGRGAVEHAQPGWGSPTLCGIPADDVETCRDLFAGRGGDCDECSRLMWQLDETGDPRQASFAPSPAATALTGLWHQRWPESRPIANGLRYTEHDRWVRFHSLPGSKRYADSEAEYEELVRRHTTVLAELAGDAAAAPGDLLVITCSWSFGPTPPLRPAPVMAASPGAWHWQSILTDEDDEGQAWTHLFVERIDAHDARLDTLLRLVADCLTADVIITDPQLTWLYAPYDGGADVVAADSRNRDELRARHADWLPTPGD
jgi:hypothetical protein